MRRLLPEPAEDVDLRDAYPATDPAASWLRLSMVSSADGASDAGGVTAGLSGSGDKAVLALLRDRADVVLVGAGTARAEGYRSAQTVSPERSRLRADAGLAPVARLALVTNSADLDPAGDAFTDAASPTIVLTCAAAPAARRDALAEVADVIVVGDTHVDPSGIRAALGELGLPRVVCEGGPRLAADLLAAGVVDEVCLTLAPQLIGPGPGRIVRGESFDGGHSLQLEHVLTDDGFLFLRYRTRG